MENFAAKTLEMETGATGVAACVCTINILASPGTHQPNVTASSDNRFTAGGAAQRVLAISACEKGRERLRARRHTKT